MIFPYADEIMPPEYQYYVIGHCPELVGIDEKIANCWIGLYATDEYLFGGETLPPGLIITDLQGERFWETFEVPEVWPFGKAREIEKPTNLEDLVRHV